MHKQKLGILIAGGVGLLGLLMPWWSVALPFFGKISQNGFQSGFVGWGSFLAIAAAAGILFKDPDRLKPIDNMTQKVVMGAGAGVVLLTILAMILLSVGDNSVGSLGFGLFMTCLGGIGILAVPFVVKDSGEIAMPDKQSITDEINDLRND